MHCFTLTEEAHPEIRSTEGLCDDIGTFLVRPYVPDINLYVMQKLQAQSQEEPLNLRTLLGLHKTLKLDMVPIASP